MMLYLPDEKSVRETVAPGLICSGGNPFDERHAQSLAGLVGKRLPQGPVERVSILFVLEHEARRWVPALAKLGLEVRTFVGNDEVTLLESALQAGVAPPGVLLPKLRPEGWARREQSLHRRMLHPAERGPWVSYGFDTPKTFEVMGVPTPEDPPLSMVEKRALENLAKRSVERGEVAPGLLCFTDEYAPERMLLPDFIRQVRAELNAKVLAFAAPNQGALYVADAVGPHSPALVRMAAAMFNDAPEQARITPLVLATMEDEVQGIISAATAPPAPPAKRGFLSKLFE